MSIASVSAIRLPLLAPQRLNVTCTVCLSTQCRALTCHLIDTDIGAACVLQPLEQCAPIAE